jgi:uncharacterized membrane protein YbhN (UPF0104 family)
MGRVIIDNRRILGSVALLAYLGWRVDWQRMAEMLRQVRLELCLLAVGLYLVTQVVSSIRWKMLARPLGFQRPLTHFASFYFIGMFFNLVLPTTVGGDVVRACYLDAGSGRRLAAFLSAFVDRLSGLLVLLCMACVAVCFCPAGAPRWLPWSVWGSAGAGVLGLCVLPRVTSFLKPGSRLHRLGTEVPQAMRLAARPGPLLLSGFVQAANVVIVQLVGQALGADVPARYYWVLVPMVSLLTMMPISLNGMGVREGAMVLFLAPMGVSYDAAISLSFVWFGVVTFTSLSGVFFYLFGRFPRYPRFEVQTHDGSVGHHPDQGRTRESKTAA